MIKIGLLRLISDFLPIVFESEYFNTCDAAQNLYTLLKFERNRIIRSCRYRDQYKRFGSLEYKFINRRGRFINQKIPDYAQTPDSIKIGARIWSVENCTYDS